MYEGMKCRNNGLSSVCIGLNISRVEHCCCLFELIFFYCARVSVSLNREPIRNPCNSQVDEEELAGLGGSTCLSAEGNNIVEAHS